MTVIERKIKSKILYSRYKRLCKKHHATMFDIVKNTYLSPRMLLAWKFDNLVPPNDILKSMTDYFGISIEQFTASDDI